MTPERRLRELCVRHGALAMYVFGSRVLDGVRVLSGQPVEGAGSDLDVGVVFLGPPDPLALGELQVELDEVFSPLEVDLVPLQHVDALFQFRAISGERVAVTDSTRADDWELDVMRMASELLPIQRRIELDLFGVTGP